MENLEADKHRIPICQKRGPSHCQISNGTAPELTQELTEVLNVYGLLSHAFVLKVPGMQNFILDNFVTGKTEENLLFFTHMLLACYDVSVEVHEMMKASQPTDVTDGHVLSKGAVNV